MSDPKSAFTVAGVERAPASAEIVPLDSMATRDILAMLTPEQLAALPDPAE
jgi:hypothetical protein